MNSIKKLGNIGLSDFSRIIASAGTYVAVARRVGFPLWLVPAIKYTKNWPDVALLRLGLKREIDVVFRDGERMAKITKGGLNYYNVRRYLKMQANYPIEVSKNRCDFRYKGRPLKFSGPWPYVLHEIFFLEPYARLGCKGKNVVDVGASIGDTAIYFALRGASHVYAYEPYPFAYASAQKNVRQNSLGRKITVINAGLGRAKTIIVDPEKESSAGSSLCSCQHGKEVRILPLEDVCKRLGPRPSVLKVDCEGCEYELILECKDETLRQFDEIILEYHYGYKDLIKKIEGAGFGVEHAVPTAFGISMYPCDDPYMLTGVLHARRIPA